MRSSIVKVGYYCDIYDAARLTRLPREARQLPSGSGVLRALQMHFLRSPPRTPSERFSSTRSLRGRVTEAAARAPKESGNACERVTQQFYVTRYKMKLKSLTSDRFSLDRSVKNLTVTRWLLVFCGNRETFWLASERSFLLRTSSRRWRFVSRTSFKSKRHVSSHTRKYRY